MSLEEKRDAIAELAEAHARTWSNIGACAHAAVEERARITELVKKLVPPDCSFLVFGSLARDEFTSGSDVDWALLIDGAASPRHLDVLLAKQPHPQEARANGNEFQAALTKLFFCSDPTLTAATQRYGVF